LGHGPKNLIFKPFSQWVFAIGPLSRKILAKILCDKGYIATRKRLHRTAKEAFRQRRKGPFAIKKYQNRQDGSTFQRQEATFAPLSPLFRGKTARQKCTNDSETIHVEKRRLYTSNLPWE
jgi:hypothetical protein